LRYSGPGSVIGLFESLIIRIVFEVLDGEVFHISRFSLTKSETLLYG
jgi:hypothetical protein